MTETHSAVVLLFGDRAYKWKKPVDFGFLDFRDRTQRAAACRRELELNRRLAPDVYLDVATLVGSGGEPVEDVLVMRRLPDQRRLSTLVERGAPVEDSLRRTARMIASLHARTRTEQAAEPASLDALRRNWEDNLETLRAHADRTLPAGEIEQAAALAFGYLDGRRPLFESRAPLACDGHGDLLADDIFCLDDGPRIIDCLDFADQYRLGDPLLDAAFLAMDLQRLGRGDLGAAFLDWYVEFTGEPAPSTLVDHYVAYRAHVRAKVACLRADQGDTEAAEQAQHLHRLCVERLTCGQVPLVLVGGLPGTGKSTVARGLADAQGWTLLSTDALRKEASGADPTRPRHYTLEARGEVYRQLLDRAEHLLARGEPVVADASWGQPQWRRAAEDVARAASAPLVALQCQTPLEIAHGRLGRRLRRGESTSDATPQVLDQLAEETPPWPTATPLDTTAAPDAVVTRAVERVRGALHTRPTAAPPGPPGPGEGP